MLLAGRRSLVPTSHVEPSEYTGIGTAPPPVTAVPKVGVSASVTKALAPAPDKGYGYVGVAGSGHFAKMVDNGIEYGVMQAYAEGFELMSAKEEFDLDLAQIGEIWRYGSVVRSWLLDLAVASLKADPKLETLDAYVEDSGEGRWTVQEAVDLAVPLPVISLAMQMRFRSRQEQPFAARMLAALRQQFGGHAVKKVR